ncbi:putative transcription factor bHLH family [Helianthus annuus]|nr:putative transcription factor bHLH family [Helianthus annuus]
MSSRVSESISILEGIPRITDEQTKELISQLRQLVPELQNACSQHKSAWKVLEEVCEHLRNFTKETKELNARYHKLLSDIDKDSPQAAIIRSLLDN